MSEALEYWQNRANETGKYYVNCWGSHPSEDNDDCWSGLDFDTEDEAREVYEDPEEHFGYYPRDGTTHVQLIGPDTRDVREFKFPEYEPDTGDDTSDWQQEHAMQAGMAHGVQGYNDAMGY